MHSSSDRLTQYFKQQAELYPGEYYFSARQETEVVEAQPVKQVSEKTIVPEPVIKRAAKTLADLKKSVEACENCELAKTRKKTVFGSGIETADLMFIGPAPGAKEDETGEPFMDEAGELFDNILKAIQMKRSDVYLTNLLKCSPGDRKAHKDELRLCMDFLKQQINLINPKLIVCLGRTVAQTLLDTGKNLDEMRGKIWKFENRDLIVTYHPAACLHNKENKRPTWEDFLMIQKIYKEKIGS